MSEINVYCIRPDGRAIYVPELLACHWRLRHGDRLTPEQYGHPEIQGLLERRIKAQKERK